MGIVRRLLVALVFAAGAAFAQTPPVLTIPSTSTTPPVVLLNGFQLQCPGSSSSTFGNLERLLGTAVYFFDNCECPNCTIEELAEDFGQALNLIRYDNGDPVRQVDVVAHSMGGLILRAYLAGKQAASGKFAPLNNPRIRKAIFIATPQFGSYQAAGPYATLLPSLTQANEMKPGSQFLLDLATWNQGRDDLRGVDAIAIVGDQGVWNTTARASDGLVSLTSASLGFAQPDVRTRLIPYCHFQMDPGSLAANLLGCAGPGIVFIDSPAHPTYQIIRSFLDDTNQWQFIGTSPALNPRLAINGGVDVALKAADDTFVSNVSSVTFDNGAGQLSSGPSAFYGEFMPSGPHNFVLSTPSGAVSLNSTVLAGGFRPLVYKLGPMITGVQSITPTGLPGNTIAYGSVIVVTGSGFSSLKGSTSLLFNGSVLPSSIVSDQQINAYLPAVTPADYSGIAQLKVVSSNGQHTINVMVAPAGVAPVISLSTTQLQFVYTGGALPTPQTVIISNSAGGSLSWSTRVGPGSWLGFTSPNNSTLVVSANPVGLSPGTYTSTITISAAGVDRPQTIAVTFTVNATPPFPSPGLYSANATDTGAAAGLWIRAAPDGSQTTGLLFDPAKPIGSRVAVPVDLGASPDPVYLSLYGTGFRSATQAIATVGGLNVPVLAFAAVPQYTGEDVVNIGPLPRSLVGRGEVSVVLTFDGKPTNPVTVNFR
jgi:pimeloyl-ACP methyl ester carboxylesterase